MGGCCILGCKRRTERKEVGISFHTFPDVPEIQKKWINATGRKNWLPSKASTVCSIHFSADSLICMEKLTLLQQFSIPTKYVHNMNGEGSSRASECLKKVSLAPSTSFVAIKRCRKNENNENSPPTKRPHSKPRRNVRASRLPVQMDESTSVAVQMYDPEARDQEPGESALGETEIKMEFEEEPTMLRMDQRYSLEPYPLSAVKEDPDQCDPKLEDGFSQGSSNNLPKVYMYTVTKYISTNPCNTIVLHDMKREKHYSGDNSIGFVQVKRVDKICTVKCMVASRSNATTSSVNSCTIICNENTDEVDKTCCNCGVHNCKHVVCALFWLYRRCEESTECPSFWVEPPDAQKMFVKAKELGILDNSETDSESEIGHFNEPRDCKAPRKFEQVTCTSSNVLNEFRKMSHEKGKYSFAITRYQNELEETRVSLYKLMCNFKETTSNTNVDEYLKYCMKETRLEQYTLAERASLVDEEVKKEILFGRITDSVVYEVASSKTTDVERLVNVMFSEYEDNKGDIEESLVTQIEQRIKTKIAKCGVLISNTAPMFAATPYGMTDDHVVDIKWIRNDQLIHDYIKHHAHEYTALTHLQMFISNKKKAYLCVINYNKQAKLEVVEVALNDKYCHKLIESCTKFWKNNVFHWLRH